ncbi:MAG: FAD:protein FMN transferase [Bacteroidota bacterium]
MRRWLPALLPAAAILAFLYWRGLAARPYRRTEYLMGTLFEITAYGPRARTGVEAAFAAVREIERLSDPRRPASDVGRLNAAAGREPVRVNRHTYAILRLSESWRKRTGGAFDVTVAPLVRVWGFAPGGEPHLPRPAEVAAAKRLVGGEDLVLDPGARTAFLRRAGMAVDLGGVAKGYAVDRAYDALRRAGVRRALVNGGGSSIRALGSPPRGEWWRIGVAHPRRAGTYLAIVLLRPGTAMGTSADNQRYFFAGGRRYAHLLDPATGHPAGQSVLWSITAGSAAVADILSTACFVRGPSAGLSLAAAAGAEGLVLTPGGRVERTPGLRAEGIGS